MNSRHLAILVGGGPAPGINAVIGAAAIGAINEGFEVHGIHDGFSYLVTPSFDPAQQSRRRADSLQRGIDSGHVADQPIG